MFNEEKFYSILKKHCRFKPAAIALVEKALEAASKTEIPFANIQMGDVVKSSQGLRLVAHLGEDQYVLIALNAFHSYNACPAGQAVGNRIFNDVEEMRKYLIEKAYEPVGQVGSLVSELPAVEETSQKQKLAVVRTITSNDVCRTKETKVGDAEIEALKNLVVELQRRKRTKLHNLATFSQASKLLPDSSKEICSIKIFDRDVSSNGCWFMYRGRDYDV